MSENIRSVKLDKTIAPSYNTYSEDGLSVTIVSARATKSTLGVLKGLTYCEVEIKSTNSIVGIANNKVTIDESVVFNNMDSDVILYSSNGWIYDNGVINQENKITFGIGDFIGLLIDTTKNQVTFYKNGIEVVTVEFKFSTYNEIYLLLCSGAMTGTIYTVNFGNTKMQYIPSNLPRETISFMGGAISSFIALKNPTTNQYYSLAEKTLILLPDDSDETIIRYGIEAGTEIKLVEDFDKIQHPYEGEILGVGKVFEIPRQTIKKAINTHIREVR